MSDKERGAAKMMDSYMPNMPARVVDEALPDPPRSDGAWHRVIVTALAEAFAAARREQIAAEEEWDAIDIARSNVRCQDAARAVNRTEAALLAAVPDQKEQR
jgi:hypothetical protein